MHEFIEQWIFLMCYFSLERIFNIKRGNQMQTLSIHYSDDLLIASSKSKEALEQEMRLLLTVKLPSCHLLYGS